MIPSFGQLPSGKRLSRIQSSPNYREGEFHNTFDTPMLAEGVTYPKMIYDFFFGKHPQTEPDRVLPSVKTDMRKISREEPSITWFGHSSYLLALNGKLILVDPVFSVRASPFGFVGSIAFPVSHPYTVDDIPDPDLLILTHDHYDHLDYASVLHFASRAPLIATSLGVGAHLEYWGVEAAKIREFDWWQSVQILDGLELTAVPSRHFSGRVFKRNQTLWSAFILKSGGKKVFVGGDSGYDGNFKIIGEWAGGFDFALLECGQYNEKWPNIHMMPEDTVQAGADLNAKAMMAVHWGKFKLATHPWTDPIERAYAKATQLNVRLATPRIGESMKLDSPIMGQTWWRE